MGIFIAWLVFAILVGAFASSKGRSGIGFFFIAVLLSPLIGFIIALIVKNREQLVVSGEHVDGYKKCPFCAEPVRSEAIKCKHCGSDLMEAKEAAAPAPSDFDDATAMQVYGIHRDGEKYQFGEYRYDNLSDAVAYARKQQENAVRGSKSGIGGLR